MHRCCLGVYSTLSREENLWLEPPQLPLVENAEGGGRRGEAAAGRGKKSWVWSQEIGLLVLIHCVYEFGQGALFSSSMKIGSTENTEKDSMEGSQSATQA